MARGAIGAEELESARRWLARWVGDVALFRSSVYYVGSERRTKRRIEDTRHMVFTIQIHPIPTPSHAPSKLRQCSPLPLRPAIHSLRKIYIRPNTRTTHLPRKPDRILGSTRRWVLTDDQRVRETPERGRLRLCEARVDVVQASAGGVAHGHSEALRSMPCVSIGLRCHEMKEV